MRKALGVAAMVGLFLLLLSALVVASPQEGALTRRIEPPTVPPDAVLAAMASTDGTLAAQANSGAQGTLMDARLDAPPTEGLRRESEGRRDANGRVLTAPRYLSLIHISEPTRQAEISYAVFCLKKKKNKTKQTNKKYVR